MSSALLKKSLDIVDGDFFHTYKVTDEENPKVLSQLKVADKKKKPFKQNRGVSDVKKSTINAIDRRRKERTNKVVGKKQKLELLHKPANPAVVNKVLDYLGIANKPDEKKVDDGKTAFTEEDFLEFEKTYFDDS